jgi:hypothetical protein
VSLPGRLREAIAGNARRTGIEHLIRGQRTALPERVRGKTPSVAVYSLSCATPYQGLPLNHRIAYTRDLASQVSVETGL